MTYFKQQSAPGGSRHAGSDDHHAGAPRAGGRNHPSHGAGQPDRRGTDRRLAMTTNDTRTIAIVVLAGIAILAALWMLAISPKREERTQVKANVAAQEARLQTAQTQLASFEAAKKQFPVKLAELKRLDKAVPARGAISSLLRQLQRRAKVRNSNLRLVALKAGAHAGSGGTRPRPRRVTPGATVGPDGLAALPFTFEFTGEYFDLRDILATVRRSVSVRKDKIKVGGRLLTIDGLTFTRTDPASTRDEGHAQRHRLHRPRRGLHPPAAGRRHRGDAGHPHRRIMMLRNLIDEVRNRRVLAFAALGVLVALALPLLFLKSAPEGAPAANTAAPAAAEEAKLPAACRPPARHDRRGRRGRSGQGRRHTIRSARPRPTAPRRLRRRQGARAGAGEDPGHRARPRRGRAAGRTRRRRQQAGRSGRRQEPGRPTPSTNERRDGTTRRKPARSLNARQRVGRHPLRPEGATRRSGARSRARRRFYIHGKLVAVFVKYSPSRKAAVFAVAPGLHISGPAKCRVENGACRYVDIPAGSHAWLTMVTRQPHDREPPPGRRPHQAAHARASSTRATAASARSEAACLLGKLVAMKRGDALLDRDACKS